jgi:general secretion pathway protein G
MAAWRKTRRSNESGFTFIELVVSTAILAVLASGAIPLARVSMKRTKEAELRYTLRQMRTAIDKFKDAADQNIISPLELQAGSDNYPKDLQQLVDGVTLNNDASGKKMKFLRRIPIDPITGLADWHFRAYGDDAKSTVWGGGNIYDVSSKSEGKALDGTKYKDW